MNEYFDHISREAKSTPYEILEYIDGEAVPGYEVLEEFFNSPSELWAKVIERLRA